MNENAKTLTFVIAAVVVVVAVWAARPSLPVASPDDVRGKPLYPNFKDPLAVTSLDITEFDEDTATVRPFRVAQINVKGKLVWRIPSHDDYPADAKDQVASAAAGLMNLTILQKVSEDQGDQQEYGVVAPDLKTLKVGATGVGTEVVMKAKDGKELLALVIGKEVPGRTGLRYVRKVGEDAIYVVEAKTDKLSTKFENWIERNLLGINTWDLKQLAIQDYSVDAFQGALIQRGDMVVGYNDTGEPKWKMLEDRKFVADDHSDKGGQWTPVKLGADQEINAAKLDELKTALDDLKIVDVSRKPGGLSADLKAQGDFARNREAVESLRNCGYYLAKLGNQVELFSNDGETRVQMKDGVQYVLRFGGIAGSGPASKDDKAKSKTGKDGKKADKKTEGSGLNRYLFVMAEFNPDAIEKPKLDPLPPPKKDAAKANAKGKPGDHKPAAGGAKSDHKADKPAHDKKINGKKAGDKKTQAVKPEDAERQRIEKENQRKQDEYQQKIADGKKKVNELNARFADWYYVISDDVYHKIHLGHDDLVKKKEIKKTEKPAAKAHGHATPAVAAPSAAATKTVKPAVGKAGAAKPAAKPAAAKPAAAKPEPSKPKASPAAAKSDKAKPAPATPKDAADKFDSLKKAGPAGK